jgi:hypothetical protein
MTIQEMNDLIASTDAAIEAATPPLTMEQKAAHTLSAVEIEVVISVGITVLTAVKALLFWKPSWQTAVGNVISYLQLFEAVATGTTTSTTTAS